MDKYLGLLGSGIKSTYHFLSDYFSHLSTKWQDEQIYKQQLHNNNLRYDISYMIREELYSVLCHCNYSINYNIKMHIFSKIKMYSFSNN